jgi:integrase/recombinase XerD
MSELRKSLRSYLALRRALGFKLESQGRLLHRFVDFAEEQGASFITRDFALRFALASPHGQPALCAKRLQIVRTFAEHQAGVDARTEVPPRGLLPDGYIRRSPYVYSDNDIRKLIEGALRLGSRRGLRPTTIATLLGLLVVSGMRIGECLTLDCEDVDLISGIIHVRDAKFGKSRLVPLHPSTRNALKHYAALRDEIFPQRKDNRFFVSELGTGLSLSQVQHTFSKLVRRVGWRSPAGQRGPRIHDFRHGFAIRTLERLYRADADVERHLPVLATYLGHVDAVSTYWYLTATPELMRLASRRLGRKRKEVGR